MLWLRLVRWKNLLIILLTQFFAWGCVVLPQSPIVLNAVNFLLLTTSTILIAAAGYIINDYFDIKIDTINKPGKVILDKMIPRKQAIILHILLNMLGLILAGYVAAQAHHYEWLLLQGSCILLLWFYSTDFKRQYITGNLVVALLTAFTILALFIYEPAIQFDAKLPLVVSTTSSLPVWVLAVYAYFAFILTWIREIVKDMEDYKGDEAGGCVTMPIKQGLQFSTRFILLLSLFAIVPLLLASCILFIHHYMLLGAYLIVLLILPIIFWAFFLGKGFTTQHYSKASRGIKLIMLSGICSLLIYHIQMFSIGR